MNEVSGASVSDRALSPSATEPLRVSSLPGDDPSRENAGILSAIGDMMAKHVENWPYPKRVRTAIALIDKTLAAALTVPESPEKRFWRLQRECVKCFTADGGARKRECDATCQEEVYAELEATRASAAIRAQIINAPETADFMAGVPLEAAHQRERWGVEHDAGKTAFDWFWLIGYLAQKAADAAVRGDDEKAMHHTISTAAALANWHAALSGAATEMRPGIGPENGGEKAGSAHALASAIEARSGETRQGLDAEGTKARSEGDAQPSGQHPTKDQTP